MESCGPVLTLTTGLLLLLAGCAQQPRPASESVRLPLVTAFSAANPGEELPAGWRIWTAGKYKKATAYRLVSEDGRTVIKASAHASASGLSHDVDIDPRQYPAIKWRWKVPALIGAADNTQGHAEDSPVRLIITFHGDGSRFSFSDKLFAAQMRMLTGYELPYATLMYIWENRVAAGTVLSNHHTSRIKMVVAESGKARLGQWREETRDIHEDFKRAFGEEPPMIKSVGIMTDTDNTGAIVDAYYGDIEFTRRVAAK
jgi:hypothetical protein